jgi:hypothetical protein
LQLGTGTFDFSPTLTYLSNWCQWALNFPRKWAFNFP